MAQNDTAISGRGPILVTAGRDPMVEGANDAVRVVSACTYAMAGAAISRLASVYQGLLKPEGMLPEIQRWAELGAAHLAPAYAYISGCRKG